MFPTGGIVLLTKNRTFVLFSQLGTQTVYLYDADLIAGLGGQTYQDVT
jgi:hypothetical protein